MARDEKANSIISLGVDDSQITWAKGAWDVLKAYDEKSSSLNKFLYIKQLLDPKLCEGKNLKQHFLTLQQAIDNLTAMGCKSITEWAFGQFCAAYLNLINLSFRH